jgi:site-specific DNA recombinase
MNGTYWGYVRVSVLGDRGGDSFISPDEQRKKIEGWAQSKGFEVAGFEEDINVSGGMKSRPGLDRILERLERKEANGIIVSNLDRLSRLGVADALELIDWIRSYGADIGIIEPYIDTTDKVFGEFTLTLFLALNKMERDRAKVRWEEAGANAISRGIHTAGSPFGYMRPNEYDADGQWLPRDKRDQKMGDRRLVPHPEQAPVVKEMFRRRAAGESWVSICRWLNDAGIKTVYGKSWGSKDIQQVISRRTYLGVAFYGDYTLEGAHEPLVDPITWESAQGRRGARGGDGGGLLRGMVRCSNCRYTLQYVNSRMIAAGERAKGRAPYYFCVRSRSDHGSKCEKPVSVTAVDTASGMHNKLIRGIESEVVEAMFDHLETIEFHAVGDTSAIEGLDAEIARLEHDLDVHVADSELRELLGQERFMKAAREKQGALDEAMSRRQQALKDAYEPLNGKSVRQLREDWEGMSLHEQREIIASVIQTVFVKRRDENGWFGSAGRFHIVWRTDPTPDIPRQGRRDWVSKPFVFPEDTSPVDVGEAGLQPA